MVTTVWINSFVVYACFSFSGQQVEGLFANERCSIFITHVFQPDADTRPTQLTVFELKAFVNNELNITIFAACTWEHNRREMHRYNLNKSIHSVNNIDERRSDQSKNELFCQKYSQAKIRLLVTLTSLRKKKKQGSPVSISLQNISI